MYLVLNITTPHAWEYSLTIMSTDFHLLRRFDLGSSRTIRAPHAPLLSTTSPPVCFDGLRKPVA